MRLNIRVLCFYYLVLVFVSSTTVKPLNGTGHPNVSIVGGVPAKAEEFPYMARLHTISALGEPSLCAGTLIGPHHVLTAAHCYAENGSFVYLNTLSIDGGGPGSLTRTVKKIIKHANYSGNPSTQHTYDFDMAIIVLNSPVTTLPFAKLPTQFTTFVNKTGVVAGWGLTQYNGTVSPILRKTRVTVASNRTCSAVYPPNRNTPYVDSIMLCAVGINKSVCPGDSGGPILVKEVQVGITSYGKGRCGTGLVPSVFTRITAFLNWIASTRAKYPK